MAPQSNSTIKILYIDDNLSLCKLFQCLGEEYDFIPLTANSIKVGVDIACREKPDVILTDLHMPDGDGFCLTAQLKTNPETQQIPIIGCSVTYESKGSKLFFVGGNKFVNDKPCTIEKLNSILEGILPYLNPIPLKNKSQ